MGWPAERLDDPPRAYGRRDPPKAEPAIAIPSLDPHPLVDQAIAELRPYERAEIGSDFDSIGRDLVSAFVLGELEAGEGRRAMVAERARYRRDRAALVFGTSLVDGLSR